MKNPIKAIMDSLLPDYSGLERARVKLEKSMEDMAVFYNALRNLLLELKALDDDRIKALFEKYQVVVS